MVVNDVFRALADPNRRRLLDLLHERNGQTLRELCEHLDMSRQAVTKHLRRLEHGRLVRGERHGRERLYELDPAGIVAMRAYLEMVSAHWERALGRLKEFAEADSSE